MNWLDLYHFLYQKANDVKNPGSFPWQEEVSVFDYETLEQLLFSRCESVSFPQETITTHGLDEVKEELRKELDDEIKQKLEIADQKTKEYSKINNELTEIKMELSKTND